MNLDFVTKNIGFNFKETRQVVEPTQNRTSVVIARSVELLTKNRIVNRITPYVAG